MADYYVDENGKITKKKKKKTSAYSVDFDGNITTHKDEDLAPVNSVGATNIGTLSSEEEEELLSKLPLTARIYHERSGGFVDTSKSWDTKVDEATKLILSGGDPDYAQTDKLLKQLKAQQKYIEIGNPTGKGMAEYQGYYNTLITAKNRDILSKTKMDGTNHSVLEEMQLLSGLSGDEKEKRKNAVLKKMDELGVATKDYALFTDDSNFNWGDFGKWVDYSFGAGFASFNKGMTATADLILGKPLQALGWENNPISLANEYYGETYDQYKQGQQLYAERLGGGAGWQFASDAAEGTIGAVPNAIMAIMSAGTSSGATSADLAKKAAYEVGNILQKAGLTVSSMMKNPQYWLSFARTYGTDYEEAKERGVSDSVAVLGATITSLVNAGIEIGPDGGSGFQGLPDDLLSGNKNKAWAWLMSSFEEGNEEGLQKFVGELVTKTMYDHDADILNPSEYAREMGIGTLSGATLGGGQITIGAGVNAYNQYQANKLTDDEKTVYDKVVEELIAEKEKDGTKLTAAEKRTIKKDARRALEEGGITIEKIEEILGGEAYEAFSGELKKFSDSEDYRTYRRNVEAKNAIRDEYEALGKKGAANLAETARFNDLHQQMKAYNETIRNLQQKLSPEATRLTQMRDAMRTEVATRVKDSRLAESYREFARSKEAFTPDMSKYTDENARKTVQNIVDSGFGNNSKAFHNTVDFLAKLSADRGRAFTLTNNESLKGTKHYKEGQVTHGFVSENGDIVLNVDSARAIETTTGHEITHVLEAAGVYSELSQAVIDYCISKEGLERYNARIKEAEEIYKGHKNTTPEAEVVADLIGEYVFSDADFVNNLSKSNRGLFERIYDEIKYLAKIATAGSKEARELERVKKLFAEAYRENVKGQKNPTSEGGVKYSFGVTQAIIDAYIDAAYNNSNSEDHVKYAEVSDRLIDDVGDDVDITGYTHALRDNDIRHIRNSHGEGTNEKYPVTKDDLGKIPNIVTNYDKVFVKTNAQGKPGLVYVKVGEDNVTYYVEAVTEEYHKEKLLVNKQMVKTGIEEIPNLHGLIAAINKKEGSSQYLADLQEIRKAYVQDVKESYPTDKIAQEDPAVKQENAVGEEITDAQNEQGLNTEQEARYSLSHDTAYMDNAINRNLDSLLVDIGVMEDAKAVRERIAARMNAIRDRGLVALPEDIEGNTYIANSSYDGTEENTTICPRSLASEAFVDAVSEYLGRPLTVEEQIYISQDLQGRSLTPECTYCYVATDRKAYRAFLGEYIKQRDSVLQKLKENPNADVSKNGALYNEFLNGRKPTEPMYKRFKMWVDAYKNGTPIVDASHLANINKLMGDINSEFGEALKPQIVDAMKYAQSASWAKKRVNYVAYNGHILKWKQGRINKLNSHYGLRMYSFSDFHPAFVLENMQMITDASVRGLKMLGYTKDTDFVEIFAPSGMNINVSTFGFESGGDVYENNLIGAEWEKAKTLRQQYPNVGVTFVATNDILVNWALEQDWIDVVIPYHLVRTGAEVAKAFNYTNYTSESSDTKDVGWAKGDKKYIAPTEHNNDKATYLAALEKNHLKPRFERFIDNPNYMKLVNECRQPASESKPVQPVFNEDAAMVALAKLEANGYYQPVGGSVDRMYEIAAEVAEDMIAPVRHSISKEGAEPKQSGLTYWEDIMPRHDPLAEFEAPVREDIVTAGNSRVDTYRRFDYANAIDETEGGAISYEKREETRDAFHRRANAEKYTVRERGKVACGYHSTANKTGRAGRTEKALQELGIPVIVHEGLEANVDGVTRAILGDAASIAGDAVYVRNSIKTDPMETAGHEAFHFWKHTDARPAYRDIVTDNINFASDEFAKFQNEIARKYFGEEIGIEDDGLDKLSEEIFAYITGLIHAGDSNNIVRPFLRDYDAVKAAWDTLVETQAQTSSVSQTETDAELDELAPVDNVNISSKVETPTAENAAGVFFDDIAPYKDNWKDAFDAITDKDAPPVKRNTAPAKEISTVQEKIQQKIKNTAAELEKNRQFRDQVLKDYDDEIAEAQAELDSKKNQDSKVAQTLRRRIERLNRLKADINADYGKRISDLESRLEKLHSKEYGRAEHRRAKQEGYTKMWGDMIGDTSTWKDMALGLSYKTKTLRRILRKVVRGADGKPDIARADRIYDELETKYDHNEALLKRESQKVKAVFEKLNLNHREDTYAHMLGELRHNPDTTLSEDVVKEYYEKYKGKIDTQKVDQAIAEARKTFDDLIVRVNAVLKEQGFKEISYRQGYFPHFTNPKQNWLQRLLNWKPIDNEIPTDIAGLTEGFKPQRSWQGFDKQRTGDKTDYSLYQGLDTYIHGALDWIYHIEDLQKRRSLENYIRYTHSDEGVRQRINEVYADDTLDADEVQVRVNAVLAEAKNPLGGLVRELMNRTNTLANKKSAMDRGMEDATNRKIYSTMTNLNNRINANMVVGSLSSALTNFIPMVQSWHQVSPWFTVRGLGDYVRSAFKNDGMVEKSDFLTNRLVEEEKLYKTGWDKVTDKAAFMMNAIDSITSQTVWRSKYLQNLKEGMSETQAIKDADQFAKNLMAGRSRGNAPTIFDAKNPIIKIATAFQLEVANQYGFMFEDTPQDTPNKARLIKGYATAFLGAYLYNSLYSSLVGRDAAFDPIGIIEDLIRDLFDDEEEPEDVILNLADNILDEVPYVSGLTGGGRIPISSALPYSSDSSPFESMLTDVTEGNWGSFGKELLKPLYYLAMPVGGGQIKKTAEGLGMFSDDHPVSGSYTDSGKLRFPVDKTVGNVVQAGLFGQYASKNAREYFDNGWSPMGEKQIQEYLDSDLPIRDYREYREGLKGLSTIAEKADYIDSLDFPIATKNLLINNATDRKEPIDMTDYGKYGDFEEFDFAQKNPGKYAVSRAVTSRFGAYQLYNSKLSDIKADKDASGKTISGSRKQKVVDYINGLNLPYGSKLILYKSEYPADDTYNNEILEYVNNLNGFTYEDRVTILRELGFTVLDDGRVFWD